MNTSGYDVAVRFAEALTDKFADDPLVGANSRAGIRFTVDRGRAYHRIVKCDRDGSGRMCHAFVDNAGRLIKSGGWKTPQRDRDGLAVRFDLSTPSGFLTALDAATLSGGYLYK